MSEPTDHDRIIAEATPGPFVLSMQVWWRDNPNAFTLEAYRVLYTANITIWCSGGAALMTHHEHFTAQECVWYWRDYSLFAAASTQWPEDRARVVELEHAVRDWQDLSDSLNEQRDEAKEELARYKAAVSEARASFDLGPCAEANMNAALSKETQP